jgi:tetratricopeptide (TPR) repeat protein
MSDAPLAAAAEHFRAGRLGEAEALARQALAEDARDAAAHELLSHVLYAAGRIPEALSSARRAVALRPEAAPAHAQLGLLLKAMGKTEAAVQSYRPARPRSTAAMRRCTATSATRCWRLVVSTKRSTPIATPWR